MKTTYPSSSKTTLLTLIAIIVIMATSASAQNLIVNPGFENGTTGWSTNCSMEIYTEPSYGGANAANNVTEIDAERCFNQQVCILPGLSYTFSYKATRRPQGPTPASVGVTVKVTGNASGTNYVNVSQLYTNTTFDLQTKTFTVTVASNSTDTKLNIEFTNYNNTATYGVVIDDISLAPASSNTLSVSAPVASVINANNSFLVTDAPSGTKYAWDFGTDASPGTSVRAKPSNVSWTTAGNKMVNVDLGNGTCTMASYSASVVVVTVLAVKMISFEAQKENEHTNLSWTTENEVNDSHFTIQRSTNGKTFDSIGVAAGMNNSTAYQYHFVDAKMQPGANYYRLKQVDFDGKYSYSQTIMIMNNTSVDNKMKLFPNPATTIINCTLSSTLNGKATINIFNAGGILVKSQTEQTVAGTSTRSIAINELAAGTYFLTISCEGQTNTSTSTFLKIR